MGPLKLSPSQGGGAHVPTALELQMQEAAERLRGGGRLVKVQLHVLEDPMLAAAAAAAQLALSSSWHGDGGGGLALAGSGQLPQGGSCSWHASSGGGGSLDAAGGGAWLHGRLPFARKGSGGAAAQQAPRLLELRLDVCAGAGVPLGVTPAPRRGRRRMPSLEAIDMLAGRTMAGSMAAVADIGPPLLVPTGGSGATSVSGSGAASPRGEVGGAAGAAAAEEHEQERERVGETGSGPAKRADPHLAVIQQQQERLSTEQQPANGVADQPAAAGTAAEERLATGRSLLGWLLGRDALVDPQQEQQQRRRRRRPGPDSHHQHQQQHQQQQQSPCAQDDAAAAQDRVRQAEAAAAAVYGERWAHKVRRLRRAAGARAEQPGWAVRAVIVKSGDDCRQEALALQLIREFGAIWAESGLPLWVRPFEVVVTSDDTALIELIPDALSVHTVKARAGARAERDQGRGGARQGSSLSEYFFRRYPAGSAACAAAQRRFTESLAAYSLITYLLQARMIA
ncbi:phosphatidylinositol 4-kinase [Monoraphidium neglectum]|uniref:Phosphatidylinositol 4-kinase n=1 Tax=Monoraphidium neglectum TaxID=145388 RepID=A0A0D2MSA7_9CHLO|nr:phosphatidylinositol 4-kinase [Monoraphidium neglectum]KIZ03287.1 phosphatidylinositol 4-kinase [Monoraphidium neglectum]|eukprot:XP_013902306.1 phosphatidylinositol 4-kinase [Monoraphidium neglectum]